MIKGGARGLIPQVRRSSRQNEGQHGLGLGRTGLTAPMGSGVIIRLPWRVIEQFGRGVEADHPLQGERPKLGLCRYVPVARRTGKPTERFVDAGRYAEAKQVAPAGSVLRGGQAKPGGFGKETERGNVQVPTSAFHRQFEHGVRRSQPGADPDEAETEWMHFAILHRHRLSIG